MITSNQKLIQHKKMKTIIILISFFVFNLTAYSQAASDTLFHNNKALLLLKFDKVKTTKISFPDASSYSISEYRRYFYFNIKAYNKVLNQNSFLNKYSLIANDFYYHYPLRQIEKYPYYKSFDNYDYNPLNPYGVSNFSDAVLMGSLNYIFYQIFEK
jgi:hypothetical protein